MVKENISIKVLSLIPVLVPGIEQVVLVHFQHNTSELTGFIHKKEGDGYQTGPIRMEAGSAFFQTLITGTQPYLWFPKDQIPFEIISKVKVQLTIFSELKNSVLLIRHISSDIHESDFYIIYFNENLSNFLLEKVTEPFSAQHKHIVGHLLSHSVQTLFILLNSHVQLAKTFDEQIRLVVKERDSLRDEMDKRSTLERQGILRLAQHYLSRIAEELGKKATLTDSAKVKLKSYPGELFQMEEIMRGAIEFAGALSSPAGNKSILIADYHIRFPDVALQQTQDEIIDGLPNRMVKTHLLLDRLEVAASGIKQRKENLTSANVGKEFPTPISAPAITDALRKHRKRIIQLFEQYPEKWEIIRHEFRPVQNLMNTVQEQNKLSA